MITCDSFRAQFTSATEDAAVLEHLRSCDACLNFAVENDGDVLFRSLGGGSDLVPPGGVDAFVNDVMREVRIRGTESRVSGRPASWRKLAIAATVAAVIAGGTFVYDHRGAPVAPLMQPQTARVLEPMAKPVIESYDSQQATIVEVPSEGENVKVIMVFDDNLPADL